MMIRKKVYEIKENVQSYINLIGSMLSQTMEGSKNQNWDLVKDVIDVSEPKANELKLEIALECLATLALYHPEASHLRYIVKMSGMGGDLERMGDMVTKIARANYFWKDSFSITDYPIILEMADAVQTMIKDVSSAFIAEDALASVAVIQYDDVVDELCTKNLKYLINKMGEEKNVEPLIQLMNITRNLERMADLCGHIAEDIIFIKEGMVPKRD